MGRARSLFVRFWAAWFVSLLLFGEQFRPWTDEQNRYFMFWEPACWIAFGTLTALMSLAGVAVDEVLAALRVPRLRKAYRFLFIAVLLTGALALLPARVPAQAQQAAWIVLTLAALAAYIRNSRRVLGLARSIALTFSPLIPILFVQMISWPSFAGPSETPRFERTGKRDARPIIIVVFDEWSVHRSMQDGRFVDAVPNMRSLAERSMVFTSAHSGYRDTEQSLPRFVFQTTALLKIARHRPSLVDGELRTSSHSAPSLFSMAQAHGYNTAMIGAFLPYRFILGAKADYVHAQTTFRRTSSIPGMALLTLYDAAADTWLVPGLSRIAKRLRDRAVADYHVVVNAETRAAVGRVLAAAPRNTLLFVHWNLPHEPFIFGEDGRRVPESHTAEAYMRQLRYTDSLLGELLSDLRSKGWFDDALLIVTADHAWRRDPDPKYRIGTEWRREVPLVVKWPGQTRPLMVSRPVSQVHLSALVEAAIQGGDERTAAQVIQDLPPPPSAKTLGGDDKIDAVQPRD